MDGVVDKRGLQKQVGKTYQDNFFKYLGSPFSKDEEPQEDVKIMMFQRLKTFGETKMISNIRSASFGTKGELYEKK